MKVLAKQIDSWKIKSHLVRPAHPQRAKMRSTHYTLECRLYMICCFWKIRTSYHWLLSSIVIKNRPISKIYIIKVLQRSKYIFACLYSHKICLNFAAFKNFFNCWIWLADIVCYCNVSRFILILRVWDWEKTDITKIKDEH